jgi:hypothetical protein
MTLAAAARPGDFAYVCDSNEAFHGHYTPAAKILVMPPRHVLQDPVDEIVVFSFGYMEEIRSNLASLGATSVQLTSLLDVL